MKDFPAGDGEGLGQTLRGKRPGARRESAVRPEGACEREPQGILVEVVGDSADERPDGVVHAQMSVDASATRRREHSHSKRRGRDPHGPGRKSRAGSQAKGGTPGPQHCTGPGPSETPPLTPVGSHLRSMSPCRPLSARDLLSLARVLSSGSYLSPAATRRAWLWRLQWTRLVMEAAVEWNAAARNKRKVSTTGPENVTPTVEMCVEYTCNATALDAMPFTL